MPLMMMGTPGRPGITMTGVVLPAQAADVVPIKIASTNAARINSNPDTGPTLVEWASPGVKALGETDGKPNAKAFTLRQLPGIAL
jgi:hypothetical protein